jgi:hypothetical protein
MLISLNINNGMRRTILLMLFISSVYFASSQGYNHAWLLGYDTWDKGRLTFTNSNFQYNIEQRLMEFDNTQGNISDTYGNFLMSSNGIWIANKNNTMMLNGGGLNPNSFTNDWSSGLPLSNGNVVLPWPDDTTKYILFHQTGNYNLNLASSELYYSIIDITGDNGNGEVIQKNIIMLQDTFGAGLGACKHANGRDWWIVGIKDKGNEIFKFLLTTTGLQNKGSQQFNFPLYQANATQPTFSTDGAKFAFTAGIGNGSGYWYHDLRIFDFNRCSGNFYNSKLIDLSDGVAGFGVAFSPNSQYLYISKFNKVLQLNTDTTDIAASLNTVAVYDGFYSPYPPFATDFWLMYLAANGKIYITSGNSVQHIHYIDKPDLDGMACDVIQHGLDLNGVWHNRSVPVHPNYYLGCDTTLGCTPCFVSINEIEHDFKFNIYPNPSSGNFNIIYLLPQNKEGFVEIFDINGRIVFSYKLPQWSTLQQFNLPQLSQGIYAVKISSDGYNITKKVIITE